MAKVKMVLEDDDGRVIGTREMELDLQSGSFHDIEGAVEAFRKEALPQLEADLLKDKQRRLRDEKRGPGDPTGSA
jgi:hypothetical protein